MDLIGETESHTHGRVKGSPWDTPRVEEGEPQAQEGARGPKYGVTVTRAGQDPAAPAPALPRVYGLARRSRWGIGEDSVM